MCKLTIIETIRFEHDDLIVALVARIFCVASDAALRHDLTWSLRWIQIVGRIQLIVAVLVSPIYSCVAWGEAFR